MVFIIEWILVFYIIFVIIPIINYMVIHKHWRCWWVSLSYFTTTDSRHYKANRNHQQSDQLHISLSCFNKGILSKLFSFLFHYAFSNNIGIFVLQCNSGLLMNKSKQSTSKTNQGLDLRSSLFRTSLRQHVIGNTKEFDSKKSNKTTTQLIFLETVWYHDGHTLSSCWYVSTK